ncbi:universal stress protein [Halegenticoccus soli]|uniref:universal stress protein n=1 Tax=Halegenticoccus soli TaxID=1985678 RepID=UPI000C6D0163|nr:universal stress protein [Halegenticoccus soli]
MYQKILLPTDGSEHTEKALEHALDIAAEYGAELHALYVVNTSALPSPDVDFRDEFVTTGESIGRKAVDAVASRAEKEGIETVTELAQGAPSKEILEYVRDNDIDLIVMGTHGRAGLRHVLLGSVAERVVRHTEVPVMLVRMQQGGAERS